ncbi:MAG: choice-of-anchor J domain-containing protein [Muribaculaceae bacterium]|nr:choice-of-anchor J domain-containing protein [Muribaculaceae bacterium]
MKKFLLIFAATALALGAAAGTQFKVDRMAGNKYATKFLPGMVNVMDSKRAPVTEQPAGEVKEYVSVMNGLYPNEGYVTPTAGTPIQGTATFVFAEDGKTVWINGIFPTVLEHYGNDSWIQGTLNEDGTKLTVPMEQSVYYSSSYSADISLIWMTMTVDGGSLVKTYDKDVEEVTFDIDENGVFSLEGGETGFGTSEYPAYEGTGMGLHWTDDDSFGSYLAWELMFIPNKDLEPTNITVEPATNSALVSWEGNEATSWNLRYRIVSDAKFWDFEDQEQANDWTLVDADGDGFNWEYSAIEGLKTNSGIGMMHSASYDNPSYTVLSPDNWMISPKMTIKEGDKISFFACGQDASYCGEVFGVFVGTDLNDLESFTQVGEDQTATDAMTEYIFDLSEFAGEAYVAIRHYNISDMFFLNVDDVTIGSINDWTEVEGVDNPYNIEGLDPNTEYEVQIQGLSGEMEGDWSQSVPFTTLEGDEFFVLGAFCNWAEGEPVPFKDNGEGALEAVIKVEGEQADLEFKIVTPDENAEEAALGYKWFGGVDEYENGFFLVTEEYLESNIELVSPGANFRLPEAGEYTIILLDASNEPAPAKRLSADSPLSIIIAKNGTTAVEDINVNNIAGVKYVNLAGQVSATPFDGVNIEVITMKDGSKKAVKVVK